jgi:hypothetical protein
MPDPFTKSRVRLQENSKSIKKEGVAKHGNSTGYGFLLAMSMPYLVRKTCFAMKKESGDFCTKSSQDFAKKKESGDFCTKSSQDFAKKRESGDFCTKSSQDFAKKKKSGDYCTKSSQDFAKKKESGDFCTKSSRNFFMYRAGPLQNR